MTKQMARITPVEFPHVGKRVPVLVWFGSVYPGDIRDIVIREFVVANYPGAALRIQNQIFFVDDRAFQISQTEQSTQWLIHRLFKDE